MLGLIAPYADPIHSVSDGAALSKEQKTAIQTRLVTRISDDID